ncbi:uncharacterized protein N7515_010347 [Penicillium bovifimosum]|uniref:Copper homeostasis protein cutC homolog n=1 Tax=Penicillium bovifimosum TaxID=126998 RepID=A0A9W9GJF0_9EURO|nr:uncharacterized protein N7515_010347 [Penicillium bovifimosum]KAJ5120959.1 hypothetical protein N7515_010347 [Penicillium bovifimosum]
MIPAGSQPILEIACFNPKSALIAAEAGADRIELCQDYRLGGLSADPATLEALKAQLAIPIYAMVRPHAEHFCYETADFEVMKETLNSLKAAGADGFVFGILNQSPQESYSSAMPWVDVSRNKELIRLAEGRPCTFHRAFDLIPETDWETALADIMDCGFASILTNGGPSGTEAVQCVGKLQTLLRWKQTQLSGHPTMQCLKVPEIIIGGGVRASNIGLLHGMTGATAFHSAALRGPRELVCEDEVLGMKCQIATPQ